MATEQIEYEVVKDVSESFTGTAKHIRLSEPVAVKRLLGEGMKTETADFVISSAYAMFSGPETYAFPADEDGEVTSWGEIIAEGKSVASQKGTASIEEVAEALATAAAGEGIRG